MSGNRGRTADFSILGQCLEPLASKMAHRFDGRGVREQWLQIEKMVVAGDSDWNARIPEKMIWYAVASSLLLCKYPIQVALTQTQILSMINMAMFDQFEGEEKRRDGMNCVAGQPLFESVSNLCNERDFKIYPPKAHPGAVNRVNVFFSEVARDMAVARPDLVERYWRLSGLTAGFYNDQASAVLLQSMGLASVYGDPVLLAIQMVRYPDRCKALTNALKALGANATRLGAMACEGGCLLGRATATRDLADDARYRVDAELVAESVVAVPMDKLRTAVRAVLAEECPTDVEFDDVDSFWSARWKWCVNGSHSRNVENVEPWSAIDHTMFQRMHRRAYVEELDVNAITRWSGTSYYSGSLKLEHGKTRTLFAGDTVTYCSFSHLLGPVENAWRGIRVELNPGKGGNSAMVRRIRRLQEQGGVNIMLDYDDFNSQHALDSQAMVIEELVQHCGYDPVLGGKLAASLLGGFVYVGGKSVGTLKGTLMSGHRGTSFLNSVLNAAYLRVYLPEYATLKSIHVGDDVYISASGMDQAADVMERVSLSPLRMNPVKQSVGIYTAEFLRMAISRSMVWGYMARAVASTVSGNWLGEYKMGPLAALKTMIQNAWTLANRSGGELVVDCLVSAVVRVTQLPRKTVSEILHGRVSVNDGPVRGRNVNVRCIWLNEKGLLTRHEAGRLVYKSYATKDYLSEHCADVERKGMALLGHGVMQAMVEASYGRTIAEQLPIETVPSELKLLNMHTRHAIGIETVTSALARRPVKGVLSAYPLLQLMRNGLGHRDVLELLAYMRVPAGRDPWLTAWGSEARGVVVDGCLPYSDACYLGGRMVADVLHVETPIRV
jgi:hypothetical protein